MSLRVLVVNWMDRAHPLAGGAEIHLHETFGRLAAAGHRITLLASGWSEGEPRTVLDGIEVHRTGGRYTFNLAAPAYFRRSLAGSPFDVVVEDLNKVPLFTPLWTPGPVVLLVHHLFGATAFQEASLPLATATWLLERAVPRLFRDTSTVAVSESTRNDLVARGLPSDRIEVIPNGVDLERYAPAVEGGRFPEPTILYLGRLKKYKRIDLILEALGVLASRGVPCRALVAGTGDQKEALERFVEDLGLVDRVEFLGFVDEDRKLELFQRSWVHALTSPKEGWGITNLEAAACGTACVCSDSPGLRDSVRDGVTGFLVPHGDVEALAKRFEELLRSPELRERMGREARAFALDYSWDASAAKMERFLLKQVAGSLRPA